MTEKQLGEHVFTSLDGLPRLFFFISTFCSKCMVNRRLLSAYISADKITEINITDNHPLLQELQLLIVPTQVVIDKQSKIIHLSEGIISDQLASLIAQLVIT